MTAAVVSSDGTVVNIIVADAATDTIPGATLFAASSVACGIGWRRLGNGQFIHPGSSVDKIGSTRGNGNGNGQPGGGGPPGLVGLTERSG